LEGTNLSRFYPANIWMPISDISSYKTKALSSNWRCRKHGIIKLRSFSP